MSEEILASILAKLSSIETVQRKIFEDQQGATENALRKAAQISAIAKSLRTIVDGLTEAEELGDERHKGSLVALEKFALTLSGVLSALAELTRQQDPSRMSAEELSQVISFNVLSRARAILWERGVRPHNAPVPPLPRDLTPPAVALPPKDDSISTYVGNDGKRRWKLDAGHEQVVKLVKWAFGLAVSYGGIEIAKHMWSGL